MLVNIEFLRVVCMLVVGWFHCMGRMTLAAPELRDEVLFNTTRYVNGVAVQLAVAMFMVISGYLAPHVGRANFAANVKSKFIRLIVPYFVFGTLICLANGVYDLWHLWQGQFYHLWFLTALFWCSVTLPSVDWKKPLIAWTTIGLLFVIVVLPEAPYLGIHGLWRWGIYFALGCALGARPQFERALTSHGLLCVLVSIPGIAIFACGNFAYQTITWLYTLATISVLPALWWAASKICASGRFASGKLRDWVLTAGPLTMGLYLYHYWMLSYVQSTKARCLFGFDDMERLSILGTAFVMTLMMLAAAVVATLVTRRFTATRWMVGEKRNKVAERRPWVNAWRSLRDYKDKTPSQNRKLNQNCN